MREFDDVATDARTDPAALVAEVGRCLRDLGHGQAHQAPKQKLPTTGPGFFLSLAGSVPRLGLATAKWASYTPGTPGRPGVSTSTIIASDAATGLPLALITGMRATHLRTAASALAGVSAARPARLGPGSAGFHLGLIGFGPTNRTVLELLLRSGMAGGLAQVTVVVQSAASATRAEAELLSKWLPAAGVPARVGTDPGALTGCDLVFSATGAGRPLARLDDLAADGLAVSLDGTATWDTGEHPVLNDHPRPDAPPPVAELIAGRRAVPAGRLLLDINGSAVADVAMAAVLLGREEHG